MKSTEVHDTVARAYTEALRKSQATGGGSCCGPATTCGPSHSAVLSGYGDEAAAFGEAAASSFGCGNPLAFAGVQPGQVVLDLGSGAGLDLLLASERVGPSGRVIGVDMTDAMIEAARRNAARAGRANIEVRKGLIEDLPVDSASVDWVISNCVINLSPDKPRVFAEIARVLRPGGQFSISDIVAEGLPAWIRDHTAALTACVAGAISEQEYLAGLRAAGLEEVAAAERMVYDRDAIRDFVASDLGDLGLSAREIEDGLAAVTGKVASVRFTGRKPLR